ncbi:Sec23/Sec24 zinc finger-containing protein [Pseudomonas sp. OIL-1]|nr:Sec23/Sec24 zinc finger-containing protein [Pseudomonas sp. OIL-1]
MCPLCQQCHTYLNPFVNVETRSPRKAEISDLSNPG